MGPRLRGGALRLGSLSLTKPRSSYEPDEVDCKAVDGLLHPALWVFGCS
jgi:hypothetical protein